MSLHDIEFRVRQADWLLRHAAPLYLDATGFGNGASSLRDIPEVTEFSLTKGRVLHGRSKYLNNLRWAVLRKSLVEHDAHPVFGALHENIDVRLPVVLRDAISFSKKSFGKSRAGYELEIIVQCATNLLSLRTEPDDLYKIDQIHGRAIDLLDGMKE